MINMSEENPHIETVHPASPSDIKSELEEDSPARSPSPDIIRVTDTPAPQWSSPSPKSRMCEDECSNGMVSSVPSPSPSSAASPNTSMSQASPMGSPTLASPPMLFQPFLPKHHEHDPHHPRLPALPFSIDNILKPGFGQRLFLHSFAARMAAAQHQQKLQQQEELQIKQELPLLSPSGSEDSSCPSGQITSRKPHSYNQNHNNNNNDSPRKSATSQPVDLSSPKSSSDSKSPGPKKDDDLPPGMVRGPNGQLWPAWVFCTRYSDRPSSGPRMRKVKKTEKAATPYDRSKDKRPRTAFSSEQLNRLKREFEDNRYLTEERRKNLSQELGLNENQIKIWFQNKRAKIKKSTGQKGELAQMLSAQGLYNHSTVPVDEDEFPNF